MQGILQRFRGDKGYGFIKVEGRGDVFVGHKEAKKFGVRTLVVGMIFEFDIKITAAGRENATNLKVIGSVPKLETVSAIKAAEEIPLDWETATQGVKPLAKTGHESWGRSRSLSELPNRFRSVLVLHMSGHDYILHSTNGYIIRLVKPLRIFVFDIIAPGLIIGWILWKYPEVLDNVVPWLALGVLWHLTLEVFEASYVKDKCENLYAAWERRPMAWIIAFCIGGCISLGYWYSIRYGLEKLAAVEPAHIKKATVESSEKNTSPMPAPLAVAPSTPATSKLPSPAVAAPPAVPSGASTSDNMTEGIWFGITMEASSTVRDEFWSLNPKFLDQYKKNGSLNTIDQLPVEFYDTAWDTTFGKVLICGDEGILSSAMSFIVSQHPLMMVSIVNTTPPGERCAKRATVSAPYMGDGVILTGIGSWPHQSYILDFPFWGEKNTFALRFHMWGGELKQLNQGYSPPWKSFAIDDVNETIQLEIVRNGATWIPISRLDECLPKKITLRTGLESGGPWIVREYKLTSTVPRQIAHGSDASQIFTWAFTWQRTGYAEQRNSFAAVDGTLPVGPVVLQDGRN